MPEGDTVHAAAARLTTVLVGQRVVQVTAPRLAGPLPAPGTTVDEVEARGKHLLLTFGDGLVLHIHLGIDGSWRFAAATTAERGRHRAASACIETERALAACHRAKLVEVLDGPAVRRHPALRALGPDLTTATPDLDAAVDRLGRLVVAGTTIGDALLDQRPACGIGNVVMQEACFLVGVHPTTPVERVDVATRRRLYATASRVLAANVTTTRRTTVPDGRPGELYVYGRAGRPCRACGTTIEHGRPGRGARTTSWCPRCQPVT